ncbi:MAG: glycan-binding surface protein [Bacteroidales bacterium]|nr:glycan-binding surface protein [Bacteroidales bacterium]
MKNIYEYLKPLALTGAIVSGFAITSCQDEPDKYRMTDGLPVVHYVRPVNVEASDSLLTGAYMDNMICIVGENLRSTYELWFNDQKAILNTSYITDNTLLVTVPSTIPALVTDNMYFVTTAKDTVKYGFNVLVPGPTVSSMLCEYVPAGEEAVIYGDYFIDDPNVPLEITFSDDVKVTNIKSITKNALTFVVPDGAEEGKVSVKTIYGESEGNFHYLDSRGMMFDFDGLTGLGNHGWHARDILSDGGITGNYVQLGDGETEMSAAGGWNDGKFAFEYWCGSWDDPQNVTSGDGIALHNLVDFSDFNNMSLKFEMFIPSSSPWSAGAMQICFEGYDKVTLSGKPIEGYDGPVAEANATVFNGDIAENGLWGRALYRPWASSGSYHTDDQWVTVTLPLSTFNYDREGNVTDNLASSPADFASLTFFVVGGGLDGTACTPIIKIDNIRAVPNR